MPPVISKSESTPALRKMSSTGDASALCTCSTMAVMTFAHKQIKHLFIADIKYRFRSPQRAHHDIKHVGSTVHIHKPHPRVPCGWRWKGLTSILRFTVLKLSSDRVSSLAAQAAGGSRGGIRMAGLPSDAGRSMSARL